MCISVIIPTFNEARGIVAALERLQAWRFRGHEVIVADGGSTDGTPAKAAGLADRIVLSERGRALQMNAGARKAAGDVLLFLHADTLLPVTADKAVLQGLKQLSRTWGRFDVRLSGHGVFFRLTERLMNLRSRLTQICTGDQAIFVAAETFFAYGGFREIALMEDIDLSKRLKRRGPPLSLKEEALTSSRRWEERGLLRTVLTMWLLRLAFFLGVSPERLERIYYGGLREDRLDEGINHPG